jgi:ABC-type multidrug transport system fused ATPase/permease subunit
MQLRQRVSLARTLIRNTPIVILDDPTSAQERYMVSQISLSLRFFHLLSLSIIAFRHFSMMELQG